jgi:antitoxin ParD1/3/4
MPMVKKSISVTNQQDSWIKAQIKTGHYGNESVVVRELIRERQLRDQETPAENRGYSRRIDRRRRGRF